MRRLNKFISDTGYCSRREADAYIEQGRVTVNGREASLGDMIGEADMVEVDGDKIGRRKKMPVYIAFNKPEGITCTTDQSDRTNIVDFIGYKERIFPVGRLDKDSQGLILLTNDGDIVNKILRAGNNNPKEYIVTVDKPVTPEFLNRMGNGVDILGITTKPCKVFRVKDMTFVIHLTQGLNRQIRRMCQALDYKVVKLRRVKVLNITLGNLEQGRWRYLTPEETREMHVLLEKSSGTEEASNEEKAKPKPRKQGSYAQYRQRGKTDKASASGKPGGRVAGRSVNKPAGKHEDKSVGKPKIRADKPTGKLGGKSTGKVAGKPESRIANKSAGKSTGSKSSANQGVGGGRSRVKPAVKRDKVAKPRSR